MRLRRLVHLPVLGLFSVLASQDALGQCANDNTSSGSVLSIACPNTITTTVAGAGRYVRLNVTSGSVYTFCTCSASYNTFITLYNDAGGANVGFIDDGCNGNGSALKWTATFTGVLRILVDRNTCATNSTSTTIVITCAFPDDPCTATTLPVNTTCTNTTGTNVGATQSSQAAPSCGSFAGGDVWFKATVPASGGLTITTATIGGSALTNGDMAVYSGSTCGGTLTQVACDNNSIGNMPQVTLNCRTPGEILYIRFWENGNDAFGTFSICATATASPANDEPCNGTTLTVGTYCNTLQSTTVGSTTTSAPTPSCGGFLGADVWFRVTVPATGRVDITTSTVGGSAFTDGAMAVYTASGTCPTPGTFTQVACSDDAVGLMPAVSLTGRTPGELLFVRVWHRNNTACGTFNICAYSRHDEPCTAHPLTVTNAVSLTTYSNIGQTASTGVTAPGCDIAANSADVWFSFVAPTTGIAIVQSSAGSMTDGIMAVYRSASCTPGTLALLECDDNDGPGNMPFLRFADLVPGDTYYVRFWGDGSATGTFNLSVWSPAAPSGDCLYFLELYDSGENGWGTSNVSVKVGSAAAVNYTTTSFYSNALIGVNIGNTLLVSYTATGGGQAQNRYELRQVPGGYGVFMAGPSPAGGAAFAETVDCLPPDPRIEDCRGGLTICGAQSLTNNTTNTGFDVDLNASSFGCLANAERQGTWYRFSPSASGTIGMTIAPNTSSNDYDFAIWGPYTSYSCPPNTAPIRCNYSGTTGNTGLSSSGTNASEVAGGSRWSSLMTVTAGQLYLLYVSNYSQSGLAFNLSWQLTGGASLDCTVLPVDLVDLDAAARDEVIDVMWNTAMERNSSHFIVERSTDMIEFTAIGTVQAMGQTTQLTQYLFTDENPIPGLNYYRLQQVDQDGTSTASPTVHAIHRKADEVMVLFPNPSGDILYASFHMPTDGPVFWRILDARGRLVEQDLYHGTQGDMLIDVPVDRLAPGSYLLLLNDEHGRLAGSARFMRR